MAAGSVADWLLVDEYGMYARPAIFRSAAFVQERNILIHLLFVSYLEKGFVKRWTEPV